MMAAVGEMVGSVRCQPVFILWEQPAAMNSAACGPLDSGFGFLASLWFALFMTAGTDYASCLSKTQ